MNITDPDLVIPLTPHAFYVLLALAKYQNNGYGLMKTIAEDSAGIVKITAGTIYPLLKRLRSMGYIRLLGDNPGRGPQGISHVYRLTDTGRHVLRLELDRLDRALRLARDRVQ